MNTTYTPPTPKVVTSVSLPQDVREYIDKNIPPRMRSKFIEDLVRQYIKEQAKRDNRKN